MANQNKLIRLLYKKLIKRAKYFDKYPLVKCLADKPKHATEILGTGWYARPQSYASATNQIFRKPVTKPQLSSKLSNGFETLRNLVKEIEKVTKQVPNYIDLPYDPHKQLKEQKERKVKLIENVKVDVGNILISHPRLLHEQWKRKVVLLLERLPRIPDDSIKGVILNTPDYKKKSQNQPSRAFAEFLGGPVELSKSMLLHRSNIQDSVQVLPGLFKSESPTDLKLPEQADQVVKDIRLFHGYSEWGVKQLAYELGIGAFIPASASIDFLFNTSPENLWSTALEELGGEYESWPKIPTKDTEASSVNTIPTILMWF